MIIIIGFFLFSENCFSSNKIFILFGFIFSLTGDIFLLNKNNFVKGLLSFLIAHIFYIIFVLSTSQFQFTIILFAITFLIFSTFYFAIISKINSNKIFVIIYSLIILFLLWQSLEWTFPSPNNVNIIFLMGIISFVISDSVLAYNRFVKSFYLAQFVILFTYFAAQYLILISIST